MEKIYKLKRAQENFYYKICDGTTNRIIVRVL